MNEKLFIQIESHHEVVKLLQQEIAFAIKEGLEWYANRLKKILDTCNKNTDFTYGKK